MESKTNLFTYKCCFYSITSDIIPILVCGASRLIYTCSVGVLVPYMSNYELSLLSSHIRLLVI